MGILGIIKQLFKSDKILIYVRYGGWIIGLKLDPNLMIKIVTKIAIQTFEKKYNYKFPYFTKWWLWFDNIRLYNLEKTLKSYGIEDKSVLDLKIHFR